MKKAGYTTSQGNRPKSGYKKAKTGIVNKVGKKRRIVKSTKKSSRVR